MLRLSLIVTLLAAASATSITTLLDEARSHALSHLREVSATEPHWARARLSRSAPTLIHAPLPDGTLSAHGAEFDVLLEDGTAAGGIHVSAHGADGVTPGELHVDFFRTHGASTSAALRERAAGQSGRAAHRVVMLNQGTYAAEDEHGHPAAWPDALLSEGSGKGGWIAMKGDVASRRNEHLYRRHHYRLSRASFLGTEAHKSGKASAGDANKNVRVRSPVYAGGSGMRDYPDFGQMSPNESPNTMPCASGCGPTAIAELMAWHNDAASKAGIRKWARCFPRGSLPSGNSYSAWKPKIWNLAKIVSTWCVNQMPLIPDSNVNGATYPSDMADADSYVRGLGGDARFRTDFSRVGWTSTSRMGKCDQAVRNQGPCIMGLGWLEHYALITGIGTYSGKPYKYIENGWRDGSANNGWVHASETWFAGWLTC